MSLVQNDTFEDRRRRIIFVSQFRNFFQPMNTCVSFQVHRITLEGVNLQEEERAVFLYRRMSLVPADRTIFCPTRHSNVPPLDCRRSRRAQERRECARRHWRTRRRRRDATRRTVALRIVGSERWAGRRQKERRPRSAEVVPVSQCRVV